MAKGQPTQKTATEAEFLAALKSKKGQAETHTRHGLVMTKPPEGPNKSLAEVLADAAAEVPAPQVDDVPEALALPDTPVPLPATGEAHPALPSGKVEVPAFLQRPLETLSDSGPEVMLDVVKIRRSPFQVLTHLDTAVVDSIVDSLKENPENLINPILVRRVGPDQYELVAGEHRLEAFRISGLPKIPARIKVISDQEALVMLTVDNCTRRVMSDLETYLLAKQLDEAKIFKTRTELAAALNKTRQMLGHIVKFACLPETTIRFLQDRAIGLLSAGQISLLAEFAEQHPEAVDQAIRAFVSQGRESITAGDVIRAATHLMGKRTARSTAATAPRVLTDQENKTLARIRKTAKGDIRIESLDRPLSEAKIAAALQKLGVDIFDDK